MAIATVYGKGPKTEVTASLTIKDFVEVTESSEPGKFYATDDFLVKETPMCLVIYPNGFDEEDRGWVGVQIANRSEVDVKLKRQFITDVKTTDMEEVTVKAGILGEYIWMNTFISHEAIKEHYKEKDFVVTVNVEMEGDVVKIVREGKTRKRKAMSQDITEIAYRKMSWTDFTLEFEGEELTVHRVILAGASPVLAAMLENQHREAREGRAVIQLPASVGRAFVRYIYLEELEEGILKEEVVAFLELGEKYQMVRLKELAEKKMLQLLAKENMVKFLIAGDLFRAARIKAAALKLAKINLAWLRGEGKEELRKLSKDLLIELL